MELVQLLVVQLTGLDSGSVRPLADVLGGDRGAAVNVVPELDADVLVAVVDDPEPCGSRFQALNLLLYSQLSCVHYECCHAQNMKNKYGY